MCGCHSSCGYGSDVSDLPGEGERHASIVYEDHSGLLLASFPGFLHNIKNWSWRGSENRLIFSSKELIALLELL